MFLVVNNVTVDDTTSHIVFELLYRCVNAIFNAVKSSSSFVSRHVQSVNVITVIQDLMDAHYFSCTLVHLFKFFARPMKKWSRLSYEEYSPGIHPCHIILFRVVFLFSWGTLFLILSFIPTGLIVSASNIPKDLCVSLFPSVLIFSWFDN